ncbi:cysteine desulfurase [Actinoplanes sp. NBRC 103695]|uniref:cysteine desulfurase n=1 Tax=Actinoplanes sp. NBRC 103695 TaxID=3032202 RepID=UPI0024A165AF|nr:cysteine desulfurase [Actinoplanes sp. NBRC 103695]GLY93612.1 putative cysteine desulfurase [Actinoplanes sp. NBRC 103695]
MTAFDVARVREDFPILSREINGHPLVYLDSANTSHKPVQVLDVMRTYWERHNANVSRSVHTLGTESTTAYEDARAKVATFIGARSPDEVVFTKNSTEAINLVAHSLGASVGPGDEVVISEMEHHSNIVPWQLLCERTGATLRWFGITDDGLLDESGLAELINERTRIVSLVHMSNILGTINDVSRIIARAHEVGAQVLLDCSQSVPHLPLDVVELGADLIAFTGHKMLGPTGIGVLWARADLLREMPPFLGGGSMIETVTMERTTYAAPPARFEAGTPPIAEAVGLGAAVDYLSAIGMREIHEHEIELTGYALKTLAGIDGVRVYGPGTPDGRGGTVSFDVAGVHPHDVGQILDDLGVEVRVGHHCARPVCARFGVSSMTRASFYLYNTTAEIDALAAGVEQVKKVFS